MSISTPTASTSAGPFPGLRVNVRDFGTVVGLLLILAVFALIAPGFLSERNLMNVLLQSSINACVALGMTLVIIQGGIDLSVGPTAALSAVLSAALMVWGVPASFRAVANGYFFGVPASVIVVIVVALVAFILLRKTPFGEYLLAVGGNEEAAHIAGVPIALTKIGAYVLSGVLAALAALILIGRLGAAEPILGNLWELDAIAASAIGGASLMGGKGSISGTLLGAIILGAMRNGLTLLNVQAFYQLLATGLIILFAMLIDRATRGRT